MRFGFLKRFFPQEKSISEQCDDGRAGRTILLITPSSSERNTIRAMSILERWRLLVAPSLDRALRTIQQEPVTIVLYDRDIPAIHWQQGILLIVRDNPSIVNCALAGGRRTASIECNRGRRLRCCRKPVDGCALSRINKWIFGPEELDRCGTSNRAATVRKRLNLPTGIPANSTKNHAGIVYELTDPSGILVPCIGGFCFSRLAAWGPWRWPLLKTTIIGTTSSSV